jgi:hypothetical protein
VAKKGAICPIFEGDMPPKKYAPKRCPLYDGHSTKAVNIPISKIINVLANITITKTSVSVV